MYRQLIFDLFRLLHMIRICNILLVVQLLLQLSPVTCSVVLSYSHDPTAAFHAFFIYMACNFRNPRRESVHIINYELHIQIYRNKKYVINMFNQLVNPNL